MNNKYPKDGNGRPLNGVNTSKRSTNLKGNNKRKKERVEKSDKEFLMSKAEKEKALREKKIAAEAKLAAKKKAREEARLLDIQMGFIEPESPEQDKKMVSSSSVNRGTDTDSASKSTASCGRYDEVSTRSSWAAYLARGV